MLHSISGIEIRISAIRFLEMALSLREIELGDASITQGAKGVGSGGSDDGKWFSSFILILRPFILPFEPLDDHRDSRLYPILHGLFRDGYGALVS